MLDKARLCNLDPINVLLALNDTEALDKIGKTNATRWAQVELELYNLIQKEEFGKVKKLAMLADPSGYAGKSTILGMIYSWELHLGCIPPAIVFLK